MGDARLFAFLVGIGFAFAMLMSFVPWGLYSTCFQNVMVPDIIDNERTCVEISTPKAFGSVGSDKQANMLTPLKQFNKGIPITEIQCRDSLSLIIKYDNTPACVYFDSVSKLIDRGWAKETIPSTPNQEKSSTSELNVTVTGDQQVRRGTTHEIFVNVSRNSSPVPDAYVRITIEDYGEDIIREFEGRTNDNGEFLFSWEIPERFDDIETLLAFVGVSDDISSKTVLFKFQVYCLPGESGCKVEGN